MEQRRFAFSKGKGMVTVNQHPVGSEKGPFPGEGPSLPSDPWHMPQRAGGHHSHHLSQDAPAAQSRSHSALAVGLEKELR